MNYEAALLTSLIANKITKTMNARTRKNMMTLTTTITARYKIGKIMPNRMLYLIIEIGLSSRDNA